MTTHSSVLAWRIPGMGEPGGLLSVGSHRVRHDWSNLAAAAANEKSSFPIIKSTKLPCIYIRTVFTFVIRVYLSFVLRSIKSSWNLHPISVAFVKSGILPFSCLCLLHSVSPSLGYHLSQQINLVCLLQSTIRWTLPLLQFSLWLLLFVLFIPKFLRVMCTHCFHFIASPFLPNLLCLDFLPPTPRPPH